MIFKINALDTLFFRDGKPFSMGDDSFAQGIFPPPPSVIYGALRSAYIANDIKERFAEVKTESDTSQNIQVNGFFYLEESKKWNEDITSRLLLPMPLDLVKNQSDEEGKKWFTVNDLLAVGASFFSNTKQNYIVQFDENVEGEDRVIDKGNFIKYLKAETQNLQTKSLYDIISSETKVGNGLENSTRTTEDGKLYRLEMNRLEKVDLSKIKSKLSILVETNIAELDTNFKTDKFIMKLGAEGKSVETKEIEQETKFDKPKELGKYFKLYFSTPIIFEGKNGWLPNDFDLETGVGNWKGINLKLISAFVGKYISIGGFDLKENKPKKMYKAVPAGSVYYFEILDNEISETDIFNNFDKQNLDEDKVRNKEGFGHAYVAKLNPTLKPTKDDNQK
jgi:CRISPR-associated protein Cmr3